MMGDSPAMGRQNAFWAQREGDSSSSNVSSHMSCSIEGKPSMDSVLRPKQQQPDQAQGEARSYHFMHLLIAPYPRAARMQGLLALSEVY
jgi:hypothetical protein